MKTPKDKVKPLSGSVINPAKYEPAGFAPDGSVKYEPVEYGLGGSLPLREKSKANPLTYLASPYSHPEGLIRNKRYEVAVKATAWLIKEKGWNVFSPIVHSHPLHVTGGLSGKWDFWEKIDREYLSVCERLVVLALPGWLKSTGVLAEVGIARKLGIPVFYLSETEAGGFWFTVEETARFGSNWAHATSFWMQVVDGPPCCETSPAGVGGLKCTGITVDEVNRIMQGNPEAKPEDLNKGNLVPEGMDNPKDLIGLTKTPLRLVPAAAIIQIAQVMKLGAKKYGPYNWRQKAVRYSVYLEAALRHIWAALDGEELDPEDNRPHTSHAAACMAIIDDSRAIGKLIDDRPTPGAAARLIAETSEKEPV